MKEDVQIGQSAQKQGLVQAVKIAREVAVAKAANGIRYAAYGQNMVGEEELKRIVQAVPAGIAAALERKIYYFVPLAMSANEVDRDQFGKVEEIMISPVFRPELTDEATCHRNVTLGSADGVFISTRLMDDRFALAFELFINVGHAFVESNGVPETFGKLVWEQALKDVRGETSQDAWESRGQSIIRARIGSSEDAAPRLHVDEKAKSEYLEAAFADATAIYQLSLSLDFNYSELREREYPLLSPHALAERLRLVAHLFPPNPGYDFAIRYRRRA